MLVFGDGIRGRRGQRCEQLLSLATADLVAASLQLFELLFEVHSVLLSLTLLRRRVHLRGTVA